jgi:hypothetical protein
MLDVNECAVIQPKTNPAIAVVKRHNLYEGRIYFSSVAEHHHHNSDMLTPPGGHRVDSASVTAVLDCVDAPGFRVRIADHPNGDFRN